jgi:predicted nucleic acid-binding Zn ribbon protein
MAGYLAHAGIAERVAQAGVVVRWAELVGAGVARAARAESVSADGTLYVRVASSAWRQELSLMTPEIMAKLNAGRRTGRITRIFWLVGDTEFGVRRSGPGFRNPSAERRTPNAEP